MPPFSLHWVSCSPFITAWSQAIPPKLQSSLLIHSTQTHFQVQSLLKSSFFRLSRPSKMNAAFQLQDQRQWYPQHILRTGCDVILGAVQATSVVAVILLSVNDHLQTKISADLQIYSTFSHSSLELSKISVLLSDCVLITPSYSTDRLHMCIQYTLLPLAIKNKLYFSLFPLVLGNWHL